MADKKIQLMDAAGINNLFPVIKMGIDTTNVIASSPAAPYTATQDCWAIVKTKLNGKYCTIDGSNVYSAYSNDSGSWHVTVPIFLKKGQIIASSVITIIVVYASA